jgi:hypothetical protein
MKTEIKANHLTSVRRAEVELARKEAGEVLNDLPPGHPLLMAAESEKSRGADLADLPESHPLKVAINEARARLEAKQKEDDRQKKSLEIRKAKRLNASEQFRERIDFEEQQRELRRASFGAVNERIDLAAEAVDGLLTTIGNLDPEIFSKDRYSMLRITRLQRLMVAARRGLSESRLRVAGA